MIHSEGIMFVRLSDGGVVNVLQIRSIRAKSETDKFHGGPWVICYSGLISRREDGQPIELVGRTAIDEEEYANVMRAIESWGLL